MRHPNTESIVRHVDGTLSTTAHAGIAYHLTSCASCAATVAWMQGIRERAEQATAVSAPADAWRRIEARLARGDTVVLPLDGPVPRTRARAAAIAAGLVLCASVVAAVVPQTGVRAWLGRHLGGVRIPTPVDAVPAVPSASAQMAVSPVNGIVHVELTAPAPPLQLRLRLGGGTDVEIVAAQGAATARFIAGVGRIEIEGASGGEILLVLPRNARVITVDIDGIRAVELRGEEMTVLVPRADTVGAELILPVR